MAITLDGTTGITTPAIPSGGPIAGTTGTFSGAVSGTTGTFSDAVQASGIATNLYPLVSGTVQTASGSAVTFSGIPSWAKRITVMFDAVAGATTAGILVRLGTAGSGIVATGYIGTSFTSGANNSSTVGFFIYGTSGSTVINGSMIISLLGNSNTWVEQHAASYTSGSGTAGGGLVNLPSTDPVTDVSVVTTAGTFSGGNINIMYE